MTNSISKWLIYAAVLLAAAGAGAWAIAAIHSSMVAAEARESAGPSSETAPGLGAGPPTGSLPGPRALPASLPMLVQQGWVRPDRVEVFDPEHKEDWLPHDGMPAEIAIVPEIESDVLPMSLQESAGLGRVPPRSGQAGAGNDMAQTPGTLAGLAPPPALPMPMPPLPGWGPNGALVGSPAALERGEVATVEAGGDALGALIERADTPGAVPGDAPASAGGDSAVVATLPPNGSTDVTPGNDPRVGLTLAELTERECASAGFFGRHNCEQRVREEFCDGRWGQVRECQRRETVVNF